MEWKQGQWFTYSGSYRQCVKLNGSDGQYVYYPDGYVREALRCHLSAGVPCDPPEYVWPKPMPVAGSIVETEDGRRCLILYVSYCDIWTCVPLDGSSVGDKSVSLECLLTRHHGWRIVGHIDEVGKKED